jgi:hypothetical protein
MPLCQSYQAKKLLHQDIPLLNDGKCSAFDTERGISYSTFNGEVIVYNVNTHTEMARMDTNQPIIAMHLDPVAECLFCSGRYGHLSMFCTKTFVLLAHYNIDAGWDITTTACSLVSFKDTLYAGCDDMVLRVYRIVNTPGDCYLQEIDQLDLMGYVTTSIGSMVIDNERLYLMADISYLHAPGKPSTRTLVVVPVGFKSEILSENEIITIDFEIAQFHAPRLCIYKNTLAVSTGYKELLLINTETISHNNTEWCYIDVPCTVSNLTLGQDNTPSEGILFLTDEQQFVYLIDLTSPFDEYCDVFPVVQSDSCNLFFYNDRLFLLSDTSIKEVQMTGSFVRKTTLNTLNVLHRRCNNNVEAGSFGRLPEDLFQKIVSMV